MTFKLLTLLGILPFAVAALPNQTIEAEEGDNVFLQCHLDHQINVSGSPVEWSKDVRRNIVHLYIRGRDRADDQKEEFKNRTVLFHEGLSRGNVTLQLSSVRLSDGGKYRCYILRLDTYCYTVLKVVKRGQLNRSRGNESNITRPSLEEVPKPDNPDGENRNIVCVGILYSVFSIFCVILGCLIVMILGTIWIYKTIRRRRRRQEAETTPNNAQMQNLRTDGGEGGQHLSNAAENGSGNVQQEVLMVSGLRE